MTRIQHRRGTAAEWTAENPVLAEGEPGYESDTGRAKIGNGEDQWDDLYYTDAAHRPVGIVADGTTNVSTAFGALLNSLPAGSVLQLGEGDYYIPTLRRLVYDNTLTIVGVPAKTRLLGNGMASTDYVADQMIIPQPGAGIEFRDVIFEDVGVVLGIYNFGEAGAIVFDNCTFTNCGGVVADSYNKPKSVADGDAGKTQCFTHFRFSHNTVTGCNIGVYLKISGGWKSVHVHDNYFDDVGRAAVWVGFDYAPAYTGAITPETGQHNQSAVTIHDNVIKNVRATTYTENSTNPGANGVLVMGQAATIHDNYIENCNATVWDDSEGIYTKARWVNIHHNVLVNAGGSEASIKTKGDYSHVLTTLDASMNGVNIATATSITLASTQGVLNPILKTETTYYAFVATSAGPYQLVGYTGITGNTLTGCTTTGTGTMSTGGAVRLEVSLSAAYGNVSNPSRIDNNMVVYTLADKARVAISSQVPGMHITNNFIDGATGAAVQLPYGSTCEGNIINNHHGAYCIGVFGSHCTVRNNRIWNMDGSYPNPSSIQGVWVSNGAIVTYMDNIVIDGNHFINELDNAGVRTAASAKYRCIQISSDDNAYIGKVRITNNVARNINIWIHLTSSTTTYAHDVADIDNTIVNDEGSAWTEDASTRALAYSYRGLPAAGSVSPTRTIVNVTGTTTLGSTGDYIVLIGASGAPTLPTAVNNKSLYRIKNIDTSNHNIATTSSQTVEGLSSPYILLPNGSIDVVSDGSNWRII